MTRRCLVIWGLVVSVLAVPAWAQRKEPRRPKPAKPPRAGRGKLDMNRLRDELNLTSGQEPQVEQLYATYRQALSNWTNENGTEYRSVAARYKEARKAGDREAATAAQQRLRELIESRNRVRESFLDQLGDVLDPQQTAKARALFGGGKARSRTSAQAGDPMRVLMAIQRLNLSPQQRDRVTRILTSAVNSIQRGVLTEAQRGQLAQLVGGSAAPPRPGAPRPGPRPGAPGPDPRPGAPRPRPRPTPRLLPQVDRLDLTDDQRARIDAIRRDATMQAGKIDSPEAKREILADAQRQILEQILTEDQRRRLQGGRRDRRERPDKRRRPPRDER